MADSLPNVLTCARIALVPVLVALVLTAPEQWEAAVALFALASVTDALDGHIARARGCISKFGTVMDPVADKLLIGGALVALAASGRGLAWFAAVVIAREVAVSALRVAAGRRGFAVPSSSLGKLKMAAQVASVIALMAVGTGPLWAELLVYATAAVTVASGLDYLAGYRRRVRPADSGPAPLAVRSADPA